MTDEPGGSEHTVSKGGISVHRAVETDGTEVVATVELRSAADDPILVEVVEKLSDDLPVESTGFKPGAMPDEKEVPDGRLRFEQVVADEPRVVVYGLTLPESVETVAFDPPVIETTEPVATGATDDPDANADDADDRRRRSVDVRLDRLSARVEEFAACAESLEALVDEHGTPDEFVDRFDERIDEHIDDRVASARTAFHEVETIRGDVDSLDDELAALCEELDEVVASMERVRAETATLREELREF